MRYPPLITQIAVAISAIILAACSVAPEPRDGPAALEASTEESPIATLGPLPASVPPIPFADNPDPEACGIPRPWGKDDPAWLTGMYEGELVQPVVYLYDSHLRGEVVGQVPHGGRVQVILSQSNPVLDYYLVRSLDLATPQEGWVPAPFLSFEPLY